MTVSYGVLISENIEIRTDPDLLIPPGLELRVDDSELEFVLTIQVVYDSSLRRYVAAELDVSRRSDGTEISGASLRELRVQEYIRDGVSDIDVRLVDGSTIPTRLNDLPGPSDDGTLLWVARIYRAAEILNMRPAKAVQEHLGLTQATASGWIRRARDRGILNTVDDEQTFFKIVPAGYFDAD